MPQFDILFFSILTFLIFCFYSYAALFISTHLFFYFFKIKMFPKNFFNQLKLILSVKTEIIIKKDARIAHIKKKLLEYYDC